MVCPSAMHAGVQAIAMGLLHSVVLKSDGTVWGTGSNGMGQLGFPDTRTTTTTKSNRPYWYGPPAYYGPPAHYGTTTPGHNRGLYDDGDLDYGVTEVNVFQRIAEGE